ncbi:hypothetical protein JCM10213_001788 [Rhodosporidiobolus nylandii]
MTSFRIDTHTHIIPPSYRAALEKSGDPSGWPTPSWSVSQALSAAEQLSVQYGVVSVTSPGPAVAGTGQEGRELARKCNDEAVEMLRREGKGRFALFGSLPSWEDIEGTLEEMKYCLEVLKCPGLVCMTSYGGKLLGNPHFRPIWDELNKRETIVFVHPASVEIAPKCIAGNLPQPMVDYPQQTTRTAVDLVLTRTFTPASKVKVILSHAGGTLPFIADRASLSGEMLKDANDLTPSAILKAFEHFYFDVALSTTRTALVGLLELTKPDKILYGSDFPYAPLPWGQAMTDRWDELLATDEFADLRKGNRKNAQQLFGALENWVVRGEGANL